MIPPSKMRRLQVLTLCRYSVMVITNREDGKYFVGFGFTERTGIVANVVDDAISCTAYGAGRMLSKLNNMPEGMINLARRRQMKG